MSAIRKKAGRPGRGATATAEDRKTVVNIKGSDLFIEWLDDVHKKTHIPKVQIFRVAVAEWAKRNGHPDPPEI
jgi:hypothetical protein